MEEDGWRPFSVDALKTAMLKRYAPKNEISKAKIDLMELKMNSKQSMEDFISKFQEFVEITNTPLSEELIFFFMSISNKFK